MWSKGFANLSVDHRPRTLGLLDGPEVLQLPNIAQPLAELGFAFITSKQYVT